MQHWSLWSIMSFAAILIGGSRQSNFSDVTFDGKPPHWNFRNCFWLIPRTQSVTSYNHESQALELSSPCHTRARPLHDAAILLNEVYLDPPAWELLSSSSLPPLLQTISSPQCGRPHCNTHFFSGRSTVSHRRTSCLCVCVCVRDMQMYTHTHTHWCEG